MITKESSQKPNNKWQNIDMRFKKKYKNYKDKNFDKGLILNFWFELDPPSPIWQMSLNHLFFFWTHP